MPQNVTKRQTITLPSRYSDKVWALLMIIGLLCFLSIGCQHQLLPPQPDQDRLIGRIGDYYSALQNRAYAKTHLFYVDRHPQIPTQRSSLASQLSLTLASYEIQSMRIEERVAQVVMHVTVAGHENHYDIVMIDHWQFVGNNWFVVNAAQLPEKDSNIILDHKIWQGGIKW